MKHRRAPLLAMRYLLLLVVLDGATTLIAQDDTAKLDLVTNRCIGFGE